MAFEEDVAFAKKLNHLHAPDRPLEELTGAMFEAATLYDAALSAQLHRLERLVKTVSDRVSALEARV